MTSRGVLMVSVQLTIHGMSCAGCAQSLQRRLQSTPGVQEVSVELATATARVVFDEGRTSTAAVKTVIESLGFTVADSQGRS